MKLTRAQIESMQEDMTSDVLEYLNDFHSVCILSCFS